MPIMIDMKKNIGLLAIIVSFLSSSVIAQQKKETAIPVSMQINKNISDEDLLDLVQKQTFRYFWDFAHPVSGLARERSNITPAYGHETVAVGGSGFGMMAIIVATERGWITRDTAVRHLLKSVKFLLK